MVYTNVIAYITIDTTGNATDFGDLLAANSSVSGVSNNTRGLYFGGYTTASSNVIQYVTIATTGNATDFGDLTEVAKNSPMAVASETRACFAGGYGVSNFRDTIDYVTIATTGNATDFGDLTFARQGNAVDNDSRGVFSETSYPDNKMDYITISTLGNAAEFGEQTVARTQYGGNGIAGSIG
jgi:hypothetical protein